MKLKNLTNLLTIPLALSLASPAFSKHTSNRYHIHEIISEVVKNPIMFDSHNEGKIYGSIIEGLDFQTYFIVYEDKTNNGLSNDDNFSISVQRTPDKSRVGKITDNGLNGYYKDEDSFENLEGTTSTIRIREKYSSWLSKINLYLDSEKYGWDKKPNFEFTGEYSYVNFLKSVEERRKSLSEGYIDLSPEERSKRLQEARNYTLENLVDNILPAWYSTPHHINGASEIPRKGKIACGYFVTTTLRDAGFNIEVNVNKANLAQEDSETLIMSLTEKENIDRFSNSSISKVLDKLKERGDGLYIIGLDKHTGFIVKKGDDIRFVHSTLFYPTSVVSQKLEDAPSVLTSSYRVLGKILSDNMMEKWLMSESFEMIK